MIVVSDTSPINYLLLIGCIDLLPQLYGRVIIPPRVQQELLNPAGHETVRTRADTPPDWLEVRPVTAPLITTPMLTLGAGEQEAISLAVESGADILLTDDRRGRKVAEGEGLSVVGTLGVLGAASARSLIDLHQAIQHLRGTTFHAREELIQELLERDRQRRSSRAKENAPPAEPG